MNERRTISGMVGKGSVNHNSRKFIAENVDADRTHLNIEYCNEPIRDVYHKLFDEALERYNSKQTRADRKIQNYYEKIRTGKQEKLFHELILQIGNRDDTASGTEMGDLAVKVLDEYFKDFRERNPNLHIFSAHLHQDEATPHLHIDFVPFITGSKRGLDTRVSLKQALAAQGFKGGTRSQTEWNQWVQSEKEHLAVVMERHGIEWEQKGTHEQHLSVIDYKKQERTRELAEVENQLMEKNEQLEVLEDQIGIVEKGRLNIRKLQDDLDHDPAYQLPEPGLETAKHYMQNAAKPLVNKLKKLPISVLKKYYLLEERFRKVSQENRKLKEENDFLKHDNDRLDDENRSLRKEVKDFSLLRRVFGKQKINEMIKVARSERTHRRRHDKSRVLASR